jgi:formylglycine-generating enzyme required for sulfatase activity
MQKQPRNSGNALRPITRATIMIRIPVKTLSRWLAALACLLSSPAGAVTIDMVTVGNPGNANDTVGAGYGGVDYSYQIGKYDVTIGQYTAFLNAADPNGTNPNGIYNASMGTDLNIAGISYTAGASAGAKYSPIGSDARPITFVSWFDAARFANWMTNGQGGPGTTENGAYTLNNVTTGEAVEANPGAAFRLPTNAEWYKAAYYSPTLNSGAGGYYAYATQSDDAPGNTIGSDPNQANWNTGAGFSVTQSGDYDSNQNYLTDVGAFSGSGSFYGTFDQSGNVSQWNDLYPNARAVRGVRGGDWNTDNSYVLSSGLFGLRTPSDEESFLGFRLASPFSDPSPVPEIDPNTLGSVLALVLGSLGLLERRRLKAA